MTDITMPRLSDSMQEGTIVRWLVVNGQPVDIGDELVEVETDKATTAYEADARGTLEIVAREGESVAVGALIARVVEANERAVNGVARLEVAVGDRVKASPVARRLARKYGVALAALKGSGPGGRITKADVAAARGTPDSAVTAPLPGAASSSGLPTPAASPAAPTPVFSAAGRGEVRVHELSRHAATVAQRMALTKSTVPDFTVSLDVEMDACLALREQMSAAALVPSFNDFVVKAVALALRDHPRINGSYRDGHVELHSRINVGVAVAAPGALLVPTIFDADQRSLSAIAAETRKLAEAVRIGEVTAPELAGGTFTVSNLGMYGITHFTAIINPPQAAILAVGAICPSVHMVDHRPVERAVMTLTLTCDHRIVYGADAAGFLVAVKATLQSPATMLL